MLVGLEPQNPEGSFSDSVASFLDLPPKRQWRGLTDPIPSKSWLTEPKNGFMEPKYLLRFRGDWTHQSYSDNMTIDA